MPRPTRTTDAASRARLASSALPATPGAPAAVPASAPVRALRSVRRLLGRHPLAVLAAPAAVTWLLLSLAVHGLHHPVVAAIVALLGVLVIAWAESRIGVRRTAVVAVVGSAAAVAATSGILAVGFAIGDVYSQFDIADRLWAPSVSIAVIVAAVSRGLAPAHRDGTRAALLAVVLAGLLAGGHGVDLARGVAMLVGLGLGRLLVRGSDHAVWHDPTASGARLLAGTMLGTLTLSWWVAAVSGQAIGVLSPLGDALAPGPTVAAIGVLILATALLLRGRRLGLVIGVVSLLLMAGLLAWYSAVVPLSVEWSELTDLDGPGIEGVLMVVLASALPAVAAVALLARRRSFARGHAADGRSADRERVLRHLIEADAGTLGFMGTWAGNSHWFAEDEDPDARGAVAYREVGGVALTVSDPISSRADAPAAIRGFARHCSARGLVPAFYSIHGRDLDVFADLGWSVTAVAEEAVIDLASFSLSGKRRQDLRTATNRAARDGVHARWEHYRTLPEGLRRRIDALSGGWADSKALPEMGFTLGGLRELDDPDVLLLIAVDTLGRVHGITSWLPVFRDGVIVGRTLDVMRRGVDPMPGVMEFLIATAALGFQGQGLETMSLSGTPLAGTAAAAAAAAPVDRLVARLLRATGRVLEPSYGFSSLLRFKAKFDPRYETLWLACPSPADLPPVGRALAAAYVPALTPGQVLTALRASARHHRATRRARTR